jgi:microcystin-dependent protein
MKTISRLFVLLAFFALQTVVIAQTNDIPYSFQGYAIDPDGKAMGATGVTVKFTISGPPSVTFEEEVALTTDAFGVFHAVIGNSTLAKKQEFQRINFTTVDPTTPVYFSLKVEVKKTSGGSYTTISDAPMNAVPYARMAANGVPVGTIIAYSGPTTKIPYGWALCDGASKDGTTAQWKQLFDVIGITWGGTGTTYNLPDLRGRFLRGVDGGTGRDNDAASRTISNTGGNTGSNVGTVQGDAFASHNHSAWSDPAGWHQHGYTSPLVGSFDIQSNTTPNNRTKEYPTADGGTTTGAGSHSHPIGINNNGGSETRPENAAVFYIIKY